MLVVVQGNGHGAILQDGIAQLVALAHPKAGITINSPTGHAEGAALNFFVRFHFIKKKL